MIFEIFKDISTFLIILIVALTAYAQITMLITSEIGDDFYTIIK